MDEAGLERTRRWSVLGFLVFAAPLVALLWHIKHGGGPLPAAVLLLAMLSYLVAFGLLLTSLSATLWLKYRRGGVSRGGLYLQLAGLAVFAAATIGVFGMVLFRVATA